MTKLALKKGLFNNSIIYDINNDVDDDDYDNWL